jgi:glutamate-1-semialdehyde 2,1-aminomutase
VSDRSRTFARSRAYHQRARRTLAGGVASALRAQQLPWPLTFERGAGAHLFDVDGNDYVDYVLAYGPMLLGHSPEPVLEAVRRQLGKGIGFGASHRWEGEAAEAVCRTVPSAERVVFSTTGTEAAMVAIRIARAATGRHRVIKFLGHYHGWSDPLHVGVPGQSEALPATGGQEPSAAGTLTVVRSNDVAALRDALSGDVAAVILEPVAVNASCLQPAPGYLEEARRLTRAAGAVLIFDEVITGYRVALGGAQERFGVTPDLTILGKALGAGFPISAVCGSAEVLAIVESGAVGHFGTFNLNPVSACAAATAIGELERRREEIYPRLERLGASLADAFRSEATRAGFPVSVNQVGAAAHAFASECEITSYEDVLETDVDAYRRFAGALLEHGIHISPKGLLYVSTAHDEADIERTREAIGLAAREVATAGISAG